MTGVYPTNLPNFFFCQDELIRFDEQVRDGLQAILKVDLQDGAWTQASLPVSARRIDGRNSQDLSVPGFISSSHSTEMLVYIVLQNTGIPT